MFRQIISRTSLRRTPSPLHLSGSSTSTSKRLLRPSENSFRKRKQVPEFQRKKLHRISSEWTKFLSHIFTTTPSSPYCKVPSVLRTWFKPQASTTCRLSHLLITEI